MVLQKDWNAWTAFTVDVITGGAYIPKWGSNVRTVCTVVVPLVVAVIPHAVSSDALLKTNSKSFCPVIGIVFEQYAAVAFT